MLTSVLFYKLLSFSKRDRASKVGKTILNPYITSFFFVLKFIYLLDGLFTLLLIKIQQSINFSPDLSTTEFNPVPSVLHH